MKWIRWSGLIPFAVVVIAAVLFVWLFLDGLVKNLIESQGSDLVGAKVELDSAHVSLIPLQMHLRGLQVTDPDDDMTNMVVIDDIRFDMDSAQLLFGKVIIDEMRVAGVSVKQPRTTSGKLAPKEEEVTEVSEEASDEGGLKLPDIKTVVANETQYLQQTRAQWQKDLSDVEQRWKTLQQGLPDAKKIADYQNRKKAINAMPVGTPQQKLAKVQAQAKLLKEEQADLKRIQQARATMKQDLAMLQNSYKSLRDAPSKDLAAIMDKYNISATGSVNASQMLLGNNSQEWVQYGLKAYTYLAPLLFSDEKPEEPAEVKPERALGQAVAFREYNPRPGFLIRKILLTATLPDGKYAGEILDISSDQRIIGRPLTFDIQATERPRGESGHIYGQFNRLDPKGPVDELHYVLQGHRLQNNTFVNRPGLKIVFADGMLNTTIDAYKRGKRLEINQRKDYVQLQYANEAGDQKMSRLISDTMAKIPEFYMSTQVTGTLTRPKIGVKSDLDQRMGKLLAQGYQEQIEQFRRDLLQELTRANQPSVDSAGKQLSAISQQTDQALAQQEAQLRDVSK